MGVDDKLPLLKLIQQHQPSQTDIKNAAVQLLNSDFVAAAAVLGRIDAGEVFAADPGTEMAAIKRLRSAARDLVKVLST